MKLDKNICKLIAELEYQIGYECYNPNSYDSWNDVEGCEFRYPIMFPLVKGDSAEFIKIRGNINKDYTLTHFANDLKLDFMNPEAIKGMKYKFGSNELFIGLGLIDVLEYLEERYDIDFNELEEKLHKK